MPIGTHPHEGDAVTEVPASATTTAPSHTGEARLRMRDAGGVAWRAVRRAPKGHAPHPAPGGAVNLFLAVPPPAAGPACGFATASHAGAARGTPGPPDRD